MIDILRPLDEVHIHGQVALSPAQYDIIMTEVVKGTRRAKNSRKIFHFLAVRSVEIGVNTTHLDVKRSPLRRRGSAGHRLIDVSLAQEWFPSIRSERVPSRTQSEKDSPRIEAILNVLKEQSPPMALTCHVDWLYLEDEVDPVIPMPFAVPRASGIDLPNVRGLRLANDDNSQSASLERLPNGSLSINLTFTLPEAIVGVDSIQAAIQRAEIIIAGLVHPKPRGGGS